MHEYTPTLEKPWNQRWAIMLKDADNNGKPKLIGVVGVVREPEIGYRIHPDYWGKGYMSEALTMFLKMWWALEGVFPSLISLALSFSFLVPFGRFALSVKTKY